jgi:hypothetical protein
MGKVKLGHRMVRAIFMGFGIGELAAVAIYIMTIGVNTLADQVVLNPIAMMLLVLGGIILSSLGVEWSKDIDEDLQAKS